MNVLAAEQCDICGVKKSGKSLDEWVRLGFISPQLMFFFKQSDLNHVCTECISDVNKLIEYCLARGHRSIVEELAEGVHYYMEGGMWVFTELYHFQRGYCCESGCRHCIYGFKR